MRSRQETGAVLRETDVPVTEFRAPVIVGSGSLSFEIIRYLTERLPVMICPRWLYTRVRPIALRNVLDYLVAALDTPASVGRIIEIGGVDVLTYGDLLRGYAQAPRAEALAGAGAGADAPALVLLGAFGHAGPGSHCASPHSGLAQRRGAA